MITQFKLGSLNLLQFRALYHSLAIDFGNELGAQT